MELIEACIHSKIAVVKGDCIIHPKVFIVHISLKCCVVFNT